MRSWIETVRTWRRGAAPEVKRSATGPIIALHMSGRPVWTPRNYQALAREGFSGNAVGYRCVRMIAEAAASIPGCSTRAKPRSAITRSSTSSCGPIRA